MKKLTAILLALMILVLPVASAESVLSIFDPVLSVDMGGQGSTNIDLTGLELAIAAGPVDDVLAVQLDINGGGSKLFGLSANVQQDVILFTADGLSNVYSLPMPAEMGDTSFEGSGINIEIDQEELLDILQSGMEVDGNSFKVSYTAVNEVLEMLAPKLQSVNIPFIDLSQLSDMIAQLKENDNGLNLEGEFLTDETGATSIVARAIPVNGGVPAEEHVLEVRLATSEGIDVSIDAPNAFSASFTAIGDTFSLSMNAQGTSLALSAKVSVSEASVELAVLDSSNAIDATTITEEQSEQLSGEMMRAAAGLISYIYGALSNTAA